MCLPYGCDKLNDPCGHRHNAPHSKIENGQREASVELLDKLAKFYGITIDQIVHMDSDVPTEITLEDKTANEQVRLIAELDEKDKSIIFSMIETVSLKRSLKTSLIKMLQHYKMTKPHMMQGFLLIYVSHEKFVREQGYSITYYRSFPSTLILLLFLTSRLFS